ncbi:MAG: histidinol dehydrogenase [Solirubrobacteraceae bacterium]|jgi:histidinol dehydrogenase|nr:histidinol dehydrogenase [Solirubrobacteraceae bacterium]
MSAAVAGQVSEILARVRAEGDEAVLALTRELDTGGREPWPLRVEPLQLREALDALPGHLREALELAAGNVRSVALATVGSDREVVLPQGQTVTIREIPVRRAAVYVPGGRAPYPSTVIMGAVTAQVAGVEEVVVCSPPRADGDIDPVVVAACELCGVDEVYRMGGAQAVAALAYGTGTVPRVDMVVGPGNVYVQEAKRQLSGRIGIDSFAGPSELVVVLSEGADPRLAAYDLLAQTEHGADSRVVGISPSQELLARVAAELGPESGIRLEVLDLEAALDFVEEMAPEHLQLMGAEAESLAPDVRSAGCVFVGAAAGTAFGDYVAGSNHVLPTGGAARFASALSVKTFRRHMTEVRLGNAEELARAGAAIARAEGFAAHAESMEARIRDNGDDG